MLLIGSLSCSIYEFRCFRYVQQNLTGKLYHNRQRSALIYVDRNDRWKARPDWNKLKVRLTEKHERRND
jgi:hypothetical protein